MNKFLKIATIMVVLLSLPKTAKSYNVDHGGIISFNISKSINDRFAVIFNQEIWLDHNFTNINRFSPGVVLRSAIIKKYLFVDAVYCYLYMANPNGNSSFVHRGQLGLAGGYRWGNFSFNGYSRFETNFVKPSMDGAYKDVQSWRNKLFLNWHIKKDCKWTPYFAAELFNVMSEPELKGLDKAWFDIGTYYAVNDIITLNMFFKEGFTLKPAAAKGINNFVSFGFAVKL